MLINSQLLVMPASVAGGAVGLLAFWNRRPRNGRNTLLQIAVLLVGSLAFVASLLLFAAALGARAVVYAMTVTVLVAGWTGMLHTVVPLGLPASIRKVGRREFAVLRWRGVGVRLFGLVLRSTPLRHLGGSVYLARCGNDPACVRRGIQDAEAVHCWSVLFCTPWLVFWCLQGWWFSVVSSLGVHALLNIYPILHLRLARGRMERIRPRTEGFTKGKKQLGIYEAEGDHFKDFTSEPADSRALSVWKREKPTRPAP